MDTPLEKLVAAKPGWLKDGLGVRGYDFGSGSKDGGGAEASRQESRGSKPAEIHYDTQKATDVFGGEGGAGDDTFSAYVVAGGLLQTVTFVVK